MSVSDIPYDEETRARANVHYLDTQVSRRNVAAVKRPRECEWLIARHNYTCQLRKVTLVGDLLAKVKWQHFWWI